jgi:aerobic carbon-monoxide dehydrogenase medium subunit
MKNFNFKSASNTKEAVKLATGRATFLAGGMTLLPAMKLQLAAYSDLINIKKIKSLSGIKVSSKSLRIGSTTTHAAVATSKEVGKSIPSLAVLADGIGDPQVRNRGTIGGSIANNDPAADYPAACLALNAIIHTSKRKIPADKFFKGMFETELKKSELIEFVEFEIPEKSSYAKFPNPASRYAIVGVYVAKLKKEVRVSVTGVESFVFRCKKLEDALSNNFSASAIDNVNISSEGFNEDIHASADYRAHIIKVMAKKAVSSC